MGRFGDDGVDSLINVLEARNGRAILALS